MNKIGGKFFSPEWFDLDREGNMMENPTGKTPPVDDLPEKEPDFIKCPDCDSSFIEYEGEQYDDEYHEGSAYKCHDCGLHFLDSDRFMMD